MKSGLDFCVPTLLAAFAVLAVLAVFYRDTRTNATADRRHSRE
jgi:hypothetical protein